MTACSESTDPAATDSQPSIWSSRSRNSFTCEATTDSASESGSLICFGSVMMAWYGVNFVLGVGLHSYGFVEGGSQGVVGAVVLAVLAFAGAAAWRRWLASHVPEASA